PAEQGRQLCVVRKHVRRNGINPTHIRGIHFKLACYPVHNALYNECALRLTSATIRRGYRPVRIDRVELGAVGGDAIRAESRRQSVVRDYGTPRRVSSHVVIENVLHDADTSLRVEAGLDFMDLFALVRYGKHMLAAGLDPTDRTLQSECEPCNQNL